MGHRYLMGLDVGGSGVRCLLLDADTGAATRTSRARTHTTAPPSVGWGYDLDLGGLWRTLGELSREAIARAGISPAQVLGVAVTSARHGGLLMDSDGESLLATPNRDARAAAQASSLALERGAEFHRRTGQWPAPLFAAARLLWLAEENGACLARADALCSVSDWVAYRLTGVLATEPSQAGATLLFDVEKQAWAWDLVDSLRLPQRILPEVRRSGERLGGLTAEAATNLGLPEGTVVAIGGADTQCGLLGCGAVRPGQLAVIAGSTIPIQLVLDRPVLDAAARLWTGHHVLPDRWVLESNLGTAGEALEYFAGLLHPHSPRPMASLVASAGGSGPGADGLLSSVGAGIFDGRALSLPVGQLALSPLLAGRLPERRRHFARALLEGVVFGMSINIRQLLDVAHREVDEVRLAGGLSESPLVARLLSDVCRTRVVVPSTRDASALGAAICAGVATGLYADLAAGAAEGEKRTETHDPSTASQAVYDHVFAGWREWFDASSGAAECFAEVALAAASQNGGSGTNGSGAAPKAPRALAPAGVSPRILVTATMDDVALARLRELGTVEYADYRDDMTILDGEALVEALRGYAVLVTELDIVDQDALVGSPELRVVFGCRGNPVNIDIESCSALGIPVCRTPGRNAGAVADLTLAFLLNLSRSITEADRFLRDPEVEAGDKARLGTAYSRFQGSELWGKTVGLVGVGAVGRQVAHRLHPFGVRVVAHDPGLSAAGAALAGVELVSLETLLRESDCVSLHAALTPATRSLIGAGELARMKPGAFLINTARAPLVDEEALVRALAEGRLGGAALDVFSVEPPGAEHPLLRLPNVIATPHIGGNTIEVAAHQGRMVADDLGRLLRGETPEHIVNPEVLEDFDWHRPRKVVSAPLPATGRRPAVCDFEPPAPRSDPPSESNNGKSGRLFGGLKRLIRNRQQPAPAPEIPGGSAASHAGGSTARAALLRILERFIEKLAGDAALRTFAREKQITVYYQLTDADLSFYTTFRDGSVRGGIGEPDGRPELTLKMKCAVLDAIFMERLNGTKAALSGRLGFSGDTIKAISLKRVQKDLNRLYRQARAELDDPGDLDAIGARNGDRASAGRAGAAPPPGGAGGIRDDLLRAVEELFAAELITSTGGNASVRIPGRGEAWITPSGSHKGSLRADGMVRIDLDGNPLDGGIASTERYIHCGILRSRPDVEAVIHTHAPYANVLGLTGRPFVPISTEAAFIGEIPRVPFILPGSEELAKRVVDSIGQGCAVLLRNHGLVVAGTSLRRAVDVTKIIEQTAMQILACHAVGQEPPALPGDLVRTLAEAGDMVG